MIMDERTEFADAVSVADTADSWYNLGSQIDTSVVRDIGQGQPVYLVVTVDTEIITGGNAGTLQFRLVSDDTASISTTTASVHAESPTYVTDGTDANDAEMKAGAVPWIITLPPEGEQYERYIGVQYSPGSTDTTAGAVNAFLTLDPYGWKSYPDATN